MVAGVAAAMAISVVATCVGTLYYCNKEFLRKVSAKIRDDISGECADCIEEEFRVRVQKENRTEREPKNSASSIVKEQQVDASEKFINERANRETITSTEWKRRTIFPSQRANVVPVRPPRRRREISRTSDDSSGQFSSIESRRSSMNNGSIDASDVIDNGHGVKRVKAQIESYPRGMACKEIPNSLKSESSIRVVNSTSEESTLKVSGERSAVTPPDTKNDSSEKVKRRKTIDAIVQYENDEMEGSSSNVPTRSSSQYPSLTDRSMMFQINRVVNASTSTKISSHAHELKEFDSEQVASVQEIWKRSSCNTEEYSITILREVLSFLSQEEKDCALELSTSRTKNGEEGECSTSLDDDSRIITIQIRKYHQMHGNFQDKPKSSESRLMKIYEKLSGRVETTDKERSISSSKDSSKTRLSSIDSTGSLSSMDKSSYYTIRLSEVDQAIFEKKKRKKGKFSRMDKRKKLSKIFQCQNCV